MVSINFAKEKLDVNFKSKIQNIYFILSNRGW